MTAQTLPVAIRPRVAHLIRLLGCEQDGEVVAVARAIGRTLSGAGVDLNALAASIANPHEPILMPHEPKGPGASRRRPSLRERQAGRLTRAAADPHSRLTNWERDFVASITPALHSHATLTAKQTAIIDRVLSKTRRRR